MNELHVGWMTLPEFIRICETVAITTGVVLGLDYLCGLFVTYRPWIWKISMSLVVVLSGLAFFWRVKSILWP